MHIKIKCLGGLGFRGVKKLGLLTLESKTGVLHIVDMVEGLAILMSGVCHEHESIPRVVRDRDRAKASAEVRPRFDFEQMIWWSLS